MNFTSPDSIPYFSECADVLAAERLSLVELQVVPQNGFTRVTAVISPAGAEGVIGVSDCSRAHKALFPRLLSLMGKSEDKVSMEVCSPGTDRNFRDAREFAVFEGRKVRVWDKDSSDWISGRILSSTRAEVTLELEGGGERAVAYEKIAKAKFINL